MKVGIPAIALILAFSVSACLPLEARAQAQGGGPSSGAPAAMGKAYRFDKIADGVYYNARVMMNLHTAKLLRELMTARGMDASDKGVNRGGAIKDELATDEELEAQNPSEVQRKLIEQQKAREDAIKQQLQAK